MQMADAAPCASERLRRIADLAPAALGEDGAWLAAAIRARLAGDAQTFDAAFGFSRRGGVSPGVAAGKARRDEILREFAARFLAGMSAPDQARALLAEVERFERRGDWSRLAVRRACPAHLIGTSGELLFGLLKIGRVPGQRQLSDILGREIQSGALNFTGHPAPSANQSRRPSCSLQK